MSESHLAVLLKDYPFVKGEPYFHRELSTLAKRFYKVLLFVNHKPVTDCSQAFEVPANVAVFNIASENTEPKYSDLLSTDSITEVLTDPFNALLRMRAMHYYQRESGAIQKKILSQLRGLDLEPSSLRWYSYWSDELAFVLAKMKAQGIINNAVSRTHNHDIYEDRHPANYLPYRNFIFQNLDGILCISEHGSSYLSEHYHKHARKFHCERLGVENQNVIDKEFGSESIQLVSLSGIVPVKQIELIIHTLTEWDGKKIEWHHIGSAKDQAYGASIEAKAKAMLSMKENVSYKFHGFIKPENVIAKLQELNPHFLLNASTFEGIPVSMMEACSLGIPIIGTDVCGVPEIVEHDRNGYLFNPKKQHELLTILTKIETLNGLDYQQLRTNAQCMQRGRFDADKNYEKLAEILKGEH